jgi:hypothetical protein
MKRLKIETNFLSETDFVVINWDKNIFFEIWWKNKKRKENNIFVIKDNIEIWVKNEIPLWLFGLIN